MLTIAVIFPLIGSILSGVFPKLLGKEGVVWIPTLLSIASFIISIFLLITALDGNTYEEYLFEWIILQS